MIATPHRRMLQGAIAAAALTLAEAAGAQVAAQQPYTPLPTYRAVAVTGKVDAQVARQAIDLSAPRTPLAMSYAQTVALREAGEARTSVDRRLSGTGLTGALGFLCGLQPRLDENSGSAYGIDPHGRFLGAKLSHAL